MSIKVNAGQCRSLKAGWRGSICKILQGRMDLRVRSGREWVITGQLRYVVGSTSRGFGAGPRKWIWTPATSMYSLPLCYTTSNRILVNYNEQPAYCIAVNKFMVMQFTATAGSRPVHGKFTACSWPVHGRFRASSRLVHGRFTAGSMPFWPVYCWFNLPVNSRWIAQYNSAALQFRKWNSQKMKFSIIS